VPAAPAKSWSRGRCIATARAASGDPRHLSEVERRHVQAVLHEEKGNKVHAARVLGISRRSLYRLIEKYHLE
jgi:DNA-binding NtrC family response regulator